MKKFFLLISILFSLPVLAIENSFYCESLQKTWDGLPLVQLEVSNSDYQGQLHFTLNEGGGVKHELKERVRWSSPDSDGISKAVSQSFEVLLSGENSSEITAVLLANEWTWGDLKLTCQRN